MNRREALSTMAGGLAAILCPTWAIQPAKRRIDLAQFCGWSHRFTLETPFVQDDWTYATDSRIAVRVRPESGDKRDGAELRLPPASRLPWKHDALRGWRALPRVEVEHDLIGCDHEGEDGWSRCYDGWLYGPCPKCWDDHKYVGPCDDQKCDKGSRRLKKCPECKGTGKVSVPRHIDFPEFRVCGGYYQKVVALGDVEYAIGEMPPLYVPGVCKTEPGPMIAFRFDGGVGLLMPMTR